MLNTFINFNKCVMKMPVPWPLLLMALVAGNMIGPLFFLDRLEG